MRSTGEDSQVSSRGNSLAPKNLRISPETSSKQVDDLKVVVARLKADLVDREKECSTLLSRAVDAEATCDQLRSEMDKVLHVRNSSMRRSVDSMNCA